MLDVEFSLQGRTDRPDTIRHSRNVVNSAGVKRCRGARYLYAVKEKRTLAGTKYRPREGAIRSRLQVNVRVGGVPHEGGYDVSRGSIASVTDTGTDGEDIRAYRYVVTIQANDAPGSRRNSKHRGT